MTDYSIPAVIALEYGFTLEGASFGAHGETFGEVLFNKER